LEHYKYYNDLIFYIILGYLYQNVHSYVDLTIFFYFFFFKNSNISKNIKHSHTFSSPEENVEGVSAAYITDAVRKTVSCSASKKIREVST